MTDLRAALDVLEADAHDWHRETMWKYGVRHSLTIIREALVATPEPALNVQAENLLAEAMHSTKAGHRSHALEECDDSTIVLEAWAGRIHDWLARLAVKGASERFHRIRGLVTRRNLHGGRRPVDPHRNDCGRLPHRRLVKEVVEPHRGLRSAVPVRMDADGLDDVERKVAEVIVSHGCRYTTRLVCDVCGISAYSWTSSQWSRLVSRTRHLLARLVAKGEK